MKTNFYLILTLISILLSSCSSDDDNTNNDSTNNGNEEIYIIEYVFEGSYSSTGLLTFSSFSDNTLVEEESYDNFSQDEFTINEEFTVSSSGTISSRITINDMNMAFRGYATMRIIDSNNEVVALVEDEYINTDLPQITSFLTLVYNSETGESNFEFN